MKDFFVPRMAYLHPLSEIGCRHNINTIKRALWLKSFFSCVSMMVFLLFHKY